jgi:peptidoglycan/LPS O-acetylase OafA/YrhL
MVADRKPREIPSLTGLRGVAALMIVIAHFAQWCAITPLDAMPPQILQWTNFSDIGMPIFFPLSGFVIALSYSHWDWRDRPLHNLVRLFFYRFARLYPAFFLCCAIRRCVISRTLRPKTIYGRTCCFGIPGGP